MGIQINVSRRIGNVISIRTGIRQHNLTVTAQTEGGQKVTLTSNNENTQTETALKSAAVKLLLAA